MQVAPQARIAENASRLSSKASANILSKVLSEAAHNSAQEPWDMPVASRAGSSQQNWQQAEVAGRGAHNGTQPKPEEDEESAFMERWSGLFSKGSPLVDGSLDDPFSDLKKRAKVVWKKDRSGHRERYQQRKKEKEQREMGQEGDADYPDYPDYAFFRDQAEGGAAVVYDALQTQWQPQRPPTTQVGDVLIQ